MGGYAYEEHTVDVNARFLGQVEKRDFLNNVVQDDNGLFLNGVGVWTISPQLFAWSIEDVCRESRVDITGTDAPTNLARTNTFSTGPDFTLRLSSTNRAEVGARYGQLTIANGDGGNDRRQAYARWLYQMSAASTVSLNYETMHVNFAQPALFDKIIRDDRYARYSYLSPALNRLTIDVGTTSVEREGAENLSGRLGRIMAVHQFTAESGIQGSLSNQYSDTYTDLLQSVTSPTVPTEGVPLTPPAGTGVVTEDTYYSKQAELAYFNQPAETRAGFSLRGYRRHVDYKTLNLDHDAQGGRIDWSWVAGGGTRVYAYTDYLKRTFLQFDEQDTDRNTGLGMIFRLTFNTSMTLEAGRISRSSTVALGGFTDSRVMLLFGYSTGPLLDVRSRR
ncbi:MAG: hypothetical protein WBM28_04410 [Burkholderiales bacterium]